MPTCTTLSPNRVRCVCTIAGVKNDVSGQASQLKIRMVMHTLPREIQNFPLLNPVLNSEGRSPLGELGGCYWLILIHIYIYIKNHKELIVTQKPYLLLEECLVAVLD